MKRTAVYPGSFDPITLGHVNIIKRGTHIFDKLIVAVSNSIVKNYMFDTQDRIKIIKETFRGSSSKIVVDTFDGLLADYMHRKKSRIILRGIRTVSDFEYEYQMALANKTLDEKIETVFMMTEGKYSYLSSTLIKEIFLLGGDISEMVPKTVINYLKKKENKRF